MKMTNLALMAATLVLAPTARSDSYTFTPGTEIPLGEDVESTATIAGYVATTGTATLDNRGKDGSTYYVLGTQNAGTTITLSLNNQTAGDYVLSFKTGMASGNATGTVTVSDGSSYSKALSGFSLDNNSWDLNDEHLILLEALPAGDFTITVNCVSTSNSSNYCGNYGHFKISAFSDAAFVLPSDEYLTVDAQYASLSGCRKDDSNDGHTIGSTGDNTKFSFVFYAPRLAEYRLAYKTGAKNCSANLNWTVMKTDSDSQAWPASGVKTEAVADTGDWALASEHTLDFGELDEGLYIVSAYVSDKTGSYAGNYGDFRFTLTEVGDYDLTVSSLVAWSDYYEKAQNVIVEEGGAILIDATAQAAGGTVTLPTNVTLPTGASAEDYYVIKTGTATTETFNNDGTEVTIAAAGSVSSTTWASTTSGDWATADNWTHGAPSASVAAEFKANATATLSADQSVAKIVLNGARVALSGSYRLNVAEFKSDDTGTLALSGITLRGKGGTSEDDLQCLEIPAGIELDITGNSTISDAYGTIWVCGKVTVESGAQLKLQYAVDLLGGIAGAGNIYVAGNEGVGSRTTDTKYGSREGYTRYIDGDCSGFTGTFTEGANSDRSVATYFRGITNGSASATWNLNGIKFGFASSDSTAVFSLGNLVLQTPGGASGDDLKSLDVKTSGTTFTLEIGGANGASTLISAYAINSTDILFKKVGTGTLTLDGVSLDSLTVAEGAIAAGSAAPTIGTLTMASGSHVAANTTVTINATTATVDGVKVLIADDSALTAGATYNLITATTLSGTPEVYAVDSEGNNVAASNGKTKNWWLAKSRGGVLRLTEGNPNAGMAIFIR